MGVLAQPNHTAQMDPGCDCCHVLPLVIADDVVY